MKANFLVQSRWIRVLALVCLFFGFLGSPLLASEKKPVLLRIATDMPAKHNQGLGCVYFKKLVEDISNNEIKVDVYVGGALGSFIELCKALRVGALEMCTGAPAPLGSSVPALSVFSLPFLFANWEHADKVLYGRIGDELGRELLDKTKVRLLGWGSNGFIILFNSKHPVKSIEDVSTLKLRTMQNPIKIATWKAFGAQTASLAYPELYGAEQQGVVDGSELSWTAYNGGKHYEVAKYVTEMNHSFMASVTLVSEKFFQSLSPRHKAIVRYAGALTGIEIRRLAEIKSLESKGKVLQHGAVVNTVSPKEREKFVQIANRLHEQLAPRVGGKELVDRIKELSE